MTLMAASTPKGFRLHIGIFGRRNVGKSSLLNAITRQNVSIVSDHAGTTTDPVEKPMELLPIGPVLFIDTAGIDDEGAVGELRIAKTQQAFDRTDLGIIVTEPGGWGPFEDSILHELQLRKIPLIVAINKIDTTNANAIENGNYLSQLASAKIPVVRMSALHGQGIAELRQALLDQTPAEFLDNPTIVGDLVGQGELAILVVPIDKEAPKGRLILPQVQTIRDLLDHNAATLVLKEDALRPMLQQLSQPPKLVVTDSQAFAKVAADTPDDVLMTSFSILFARLKGDLITQVQGAMAVDSLKPGDRVLVAEACSHHPITEDIGRVKIPKWLSHYVGGELRFEHVQGHDYPQDISPYQLIIHCGACMWNRREMLARMLHCRQAGVPVTNYGLTIAYTLGIFGRALEPFPDALEIYRSRQD